MREGGYEGDDAEISDPRHPGAPAFKGDDVKKSVKVISRASRAALFGKLDAPRKNVLLLDEPTNHRHESTESPNQHADFTGTLFFVVP